MSDTMNKTISCKLLENVGGILPSKARGAKKLWCYVPGKFNEWTDQHTNSTIEGIKTVLESVKGIDESDSTGNVEYEQRQSNTYFAIKDKVSYTVKKNGDEWEIEGGNDIGENGFYKVMGDSITYNGFFESPYEVLNGKTFTHYVDDLYYTTIGTTTVWIKENNGWPKIYRLENSYTYTLPAYYDASGFTDDLAYLNGLRFYRTKYNVYEAVKNAGTDFEEVYYLQPVDATCDTWVVVAAEDVPVGIQSNSSESVDEGDSQE